jgi:hypothetical protein
MAPADPRAQEPLTARWSRAGPKRADAATRIAFEVSPDIRVGTIVEAEP